MTDPFRAAAFNAPVAFPITIVSADPHAAIGFSARQIRGAVLASVAACVLLLWAAGLTINPFARSNIPYYAMLALVPLIRVACARDGRRWSRALADWTEYCALFTAMALTGAVCSYPIAALSEGFADATLHRIDLALRFDWLAWYRLVADHRALQLLGMAAYQCIYLTPALLLGWFACTGQRREAHRFLAAFWIAAIFTLALFSQMPAVGPLSALWKGPIPYMPLSELWQPDLIPPLRRGEVHQVDLGQLRGLVSAPSFHAASATLYIATAWRCGPLRWLLIAITGAMLLATPVEGTHYLIDLILGAAVALVALGCASALIARRRALP
ncbi:phosphatase PAP2 family protein [Sphingomonas sp. HT-1]|uniref:phosphatase PAP2 family protein n=1 Tax=unclassified Sphingomonas TaxID=196159 RepID=UPI00030BE34A|nr:MULTISPECIES: phosphatase PAP2 family protein [unclassified Sphingomonas]KTF70495.1 phosphatase [Sphingomonas sp. WG]